MNLTYVIPIFLQSKGWYIHFLYIQNKKTPPKKNQTNKKKKKKNGNNYDEDWHVHGSWTCTCPFCIVLPNNTSFIYLTCFNACQENWIEYGTGEIYMYKGGSRTGAPGAPPPPLGFFFFFFFWGGGGGGGTQGPVSQQV